MIRDVLLAIHALAWLVVVILTAWRSGVIDPVLWGALGAGVGVIMGIFRVDENSARKPSSEEEAHD